MCRTLGIRHISYFSSNILCICTIFNVQSAHVFRLNINLKTCGELFLCNFFYDFVAGVQLLGFWVLTLCGAVCFVGTEELTAFHD